MADQFKAKADTEYINQQTGQKVRFTENQLNTPGGAIGTLSSQFVPSAQNKPVMNASMDTNAFRKDLKTRDENVAQIAENNANDINRRLDQKLNEMAKPYDINNDPYAKQQQDLYQNRMQQTDQRLVEDINRTKEQYAQNREQTELVGRQNEGRLKSALARVGALDATPVISAGAMSSEAMNTQKSLNSLLLEEQQAVQAYNRAKEDGDFELMNKMYDIARNARKDYEAKQQQELENILGVSEEKRAQEQQQRDAIRFEREGLTFEQQQEDRVRQQTQSQLDALIAGGVPLIDPETGQANISPEEIAQLEQNLGLLPGTFENYYNNLYDATLAEQAGKQTEADIKRIEALKDIPEGTTVIIGGKEYQGLKPKEESSPEVVGNVEDGVYERMPDGSWQQVIAPRSSGTSAGDEVISDSLAEELGLDLGTTRNEANQVLQQRNAELKEQKDMTNDDFAHDLELKLEQIDKILNNPAMDEVVGDNPLARIKLPFHKGERNEVLSNIENLISKETIQALIDAKDQGASFGALSDTELEMLRQQASVISGYIKTKENGDKYIEVSEKTFEEEVNKMRNEINRQIARTYGYGDPDQLADMYEEETGEDLERDEKGNIKKSYAEMAQTLRDMQKDPEGLFDDSSGLFTTDLTLSQNGSNELGSLSEKYESGGDPGAIGYDSTGGYSYGAYQLAHNNAKRFVESSSYAQEFEGIAFNSQAFQNKWKEIAQRDPQGFKAEQKAYIGQTHYQPQLDKIARETGLNVNRLSPAMQDVIWSTAVQHGANTDIIVNALKQLGRNATEEQVINKIYDLRWSGGQQFRSSTQQVKNSVKKRFDSERQLALSKLRNTA